MKNREICYLECEVCKHQDLGDDWSLVCLKGHVIIEDGVNGEMFCPDFEEGPNWMSKTIINFPSQASDVTNKEDL